MLYGPAGPLRLDDAATFVKGLERHQQLRLTINSRAESTSASNLNLWPKALSPVPQFVRFKLVVRLRT